MTTIFSELRAEPVKFIDDGDRVIGFYMWRGRAGASGVSLDSFEVESGFICDFRDGKAIRARFWTSWAAAREAAGLPLA